MKIRVAVGAAGAGLLFVAGIVDARIGLLPSNQHISAVGKQIALVTRRDDPNRARGLFPEGMVIGHDGAFLLITNNGFISQSLMTLNTRTRVVKGRMIETGFNSLFQGVALAPDGRTGFASSGGFADPDSFHIVRTLRVGDDGAITLGDSIQLPPRMDETSFGPFPLGLAVSPDSQRLYVVENLVDSLAVIDTQSHAILHTIAVGKSPWGVAVHPTRHEAYVTNRGDRTVSVVDTDANVMRASVGTGANPNAIAVTPDGGRVFVANANSDDVTVFDVVDLTSVRTISLTPFDGAQPGSSPSALAISPDGHTVYVALSWENAVAVIDAATETLRGYIPTGFYPSAVAVSSDSRTLYIANMKGSRTYPRTPRVQPLDYGFNIQLGGTYGVLGTMSILPVPSAAKLRGFTRRVMANNGYDTPTHVRPSNREPFAGPCLPIPCTANDVSPIKHVFFVVRENKTYDEVLGDLPEGDGDHSLTLYPRNVSPNTHALAEEFVLLDRLFANSEKSEPGHNWTMGSIDSDYGERTWVPVSFDVRPDDIGSHHSNNLGEAIRGTMAQIATPEGGFWFDNCFRHGVSFRNYGEFLRMQDDGVTPIDYWAQNTNFDFHVFDLSLTDVSRFEVWRTEFQQQAAAGTVPQFSYIALPNDHTGGATGGMYTPQAYVADNDFALGKVVETISNANDVWRQSVIFVVEDDPQSGGDHIDSHRTVGLVIGPYVKRHEVNHTRYDMASMHRTMELILGLPPMSIFDQMAIVMRDVFTDTPDFTPYAALPQGVPLSRNPMGTKLDDLSRRYDFSRPDRVPDAVLNKILWEYFKQNGRGR